MRLLYPKNRLGSKYAHFVTASAWPTLVFLLVGILAFIFMAESVELDMMNTFPAVLDSGRAVITIGSEADIAAGKMYMYANRNEYVAVVDISRVETAAGQTLLYPATSSMAAMDGLDGAVYLDVPRGKESLLRRMIVRVGKSNE